MARGDGGGARGIGGGVVHPRARRPPGRLLRVQALVEDGVLKGHEATAGEERQAEATLEEALGAYRTDAVTDAVMAADSRLPFDTPRRAVSVLMMPITITTRSGRWR